MLVCTLVVGKVAKAARSQLQLTLNPHSQAGHISVKAYQRTVTLAFNSLEDFSKRFHCKLELNKTFWDVYTKMGMCACLPHSLCEGRITEVIEPSRACSNFICRQNSSSQMRPTLAFRQDSAALQYTIYQTLPISLSQPSFCGNNYMSMKSHNLPNTSLQKCFLKNFTSASEAPNNCNEHINLTDAEQEIPITPWKLGNFTWFFHQAA